LRQAVCCEPCHPCHAFALQAFKASSFTLTSASLLLPGGSSLFRRLVTWCDAGDVQAFAVFGGEVEGIAERLGFVWLQSGNVDVVWIEPGCAVGAEFVEPSAIALSGAGQVGNEGDGEALACWRVRQDVIALAVGVLVAG
jgi:hypothetical protein